MPTLLPGFLRRTLRLGYEEEEEEEAEEEDGEEEENVDEEDEKEEGDEIVDKNDNCYDYDTYHNKVGNHKNQSNQNNKEHHVRVDYFHDSQTIKSNSISSINNTNPLFDTPKPSPTIITTDTTVTTPSDPTRTIASIVSATDALSFPSELNSNYKKKIDQESNEMNHYDNDSDVGMIIQPTTSTNSYDTNNNNDEDIYDEEEFTLKTISRHPYQQQEELNNDEEEQQQQQDQLQQPLSAASGPIDSLELVKSPQHHQSNILRSSSNRSSGNLMSMNNNNNNISINRLGRENSIHNSYYSPPRKTYREIQFDKIIKQDVININELSTLSWNGIPIQYRAITWKLLLHYVPTNVNRRMNTLRRKRNEYYDIYVEQHYNSENDDERTIQEQEILRQVLVDVPRTQPNIPLFRHDKIKKLLSRLLYIWAMRHPASSYVQGINDLTTPLVVVFLTDYFIHNNNNENDHDSLVDQAINRAMIKNNDENDNNCNDNDNSNSSNVSSALNNNIRDHNDPNDSNHNDDDDDRRSSTTESIRSDRYPSDYDIPNVNASTASYGNVNNNNNDNYDFLRTLPDIVLEGHVMNHISDDKLKELEADVYWCLTSLLSGIQDHYTNDQPGIQRMVGRLEELMNRIDNELCQHLYNQGILFIQFAFKWMNCLLLREITLKCVIRLWDTYLSESESSLSYNNNKSFEDFHVYVCAAFLCQFSNQLQSMSFDELFMFFQQIPVTKDWNDNDIEILLSQAYVLSTLFRNSDAHLTCVSTNR